MYNLKLICKFFNNTRTLLELDNMTSEVFEVGQVISITKSTKIKIQMFNNEELDEMKEDSNSQKLNSKNIEYFKILKRESVMTNNRKHNLTFFCGVYNID